MGTARLIRESELDELLALYQMLNPDDPELDQEVARDRWDEMLRDDLLEIVVVEDGDRLVASCVLSVTKNLTRGARPFAVIENVVTHEDHRSEGFGTQCVENAIDRARERDCYKVMLLTGSDEDWKHQFYERCGFDKEEKTGFVLSLP